MKLKAVLETLDGLNEAFHELYTEKDGKFLLTGVEGVKTQADIDRVNRALAQEKEAHKKTKEKLAPLADYLEDVDATVEKLTGYDDLVARAEGKGKNDAAIVSENTQLKKDLTAAQRQLKALGEEVTTLKTTNTELTAKEKRRIIHDAVRAAGVKTKMLDTAVDDALMLAERVMDVDENYNVVTKDGVGVTPGLDAHTWLTEVQPKRPHWWPASVGGGAKGSGGGGGFVNNPWTAENWNMTEQGRIYNEDPAKAERMAKSAGTEIGGRKPAPKK